MDFRISGSALVMSGPVASDDLARLKDSLASGKVKLIVLHESPGGDLWNALRLGERIRDAQVPTAVSGKCQSACGLIFLGGVTRSFSDGRPLGQTMVGLHGAHHPVTKDAIIHQSYEIERYIRRMTDDRYPADFLERTVYPKDPRDFVFMLHPRRFKDPDKPQGVMECRIQSDSKFVCAMVKDLNALSTGVVTNPEILQLDPELRQSLAEKQP